jgi:hypothetical protein
MVLISQADCFVQSPDDARGRFWAPLKLSGACLRSPAWPQLARSTDCQAPVAENDLEVTTCWKIADGMCKPGTEQQGQGRRNHGYEWYDTLNARYHND